MVGHYGSRASHLCRTWWAWIRSMLSSSGAAQTAELSKESSGLREPGFKVENGHGEGATAA